MDDHRPILVIEDDANAAELLTRALHQVGLSRPVRVLADGEQAVAYLAGEPPFRDRHDHPLPCLLLLDVRLPGKSGVEVLSWLRSQVRLRTLPVMMLTGSSSSRDIEEALKLGIRSYCVKPTSYDEMKRLARTIRRKVDGAAVESEDALRQSRG